MKRSTKNSTRDIHSSLANSQSHFHLSHNAYRQRPGARTPKSRKARPTTACQLYTACKLQPDRCIRCITEATLSLELRSNTRQGGNPVPRSQQPTCSHGTPRARGPTRAPSQSIPQPRPLPNPPLALRPTYHAHLRTSSHCRPARAAPRSYPKAHAPYV